jgi:hypothetical protein
MFQCCFKVLSIISSFFLDFEGGYWTLWCWFLAWHVLQPRSWRGHVSPKYQLTFNHDIISQETDIFITTMFKILIPYKSLIMPLFQNTNLYRIIFRVLSLLGSWKWTLRCHFFLYNLALLADLQALRI